jgi:metal-sulfur cluster biosynthetic enzyme
MESNIDPTVGAEIADGTVVTVAAATVPVTTPEEVRVVLRGVKDPDLNLNIVDLGLIYDVRVDGSVIAVDMTLTSPGCPSGPEIMQEAERQLRELPGVTEVRMNLIWTPFWTPERIEPKVRAYLGL